MVVMWWFGFFAVVKGDFGITVEAEEEVVADVVWGESYKPFLGENGMRRMVKFIQMGLELDKLVAQTLC